MLTSNGVSGVWCCPLLSLCCLQMLERCLRIFWRGMSALYGFTFKLFLKGWMRTRMYRSVQALYGVANVLHWKSSERQFSTHMTVLKHQNHPVILDRSQPPFYFIPRKSCNTGKISKILTFLDCLLFLTCRWISIGGVNGSEPEIRRDFEEKQSSEPRKLEQRGW